ncbi:hypothetical protein SOVF_048730 [Spinacia oleracea]|nr:hypothetical protein SOVF_048730 [Spinacia oleracea]
MEGKQKCRTFCPKGAWRLPFILPYWDKIRKLDDRVKELDSLKVSSNSAPSTEATKKCAIMSHPSPENFPGKTNVVESLEKVVSVQPCESSACSNTAQDIYEVPICSYIDSSNIKKESYNEPLLSPESAKSSKKSDSKDKIDWEKKPLLSPGSSNESPKLKDRKTDKPLLFKHPTLGGVADFELQQFNRRLKQLEDQRNGKLDLAWGEIWKSDVKELLISPESAKSSKTNDSKDKIDWEKKPLLSPGSSNESPKLKDRKTDKPLLFEHPTLGGVADFELQQFNRRLKQLEDQRFVTRGHETLKKLKKKN